MNETFEDYMVRKGWIGHSERCLEIWNDWQRDRQYLIANMDAAEQQRDELQNEAYRTAGQLVRLVIALRIIAGYEQCADNTMGNAEIAKQALEYSEEDLFIGKAIAKAQGV